MRGLNDDEILDFAKLTFGKPYQVRFIEFMPIGPQTVWRAERFIPGTEIKSQIQSLGKLIPIKPQSFDGPARRFKFCLAKGEIGLINPLSNHFCPSCNRLRLTADGKRWSCLCSDKGIDVKTPLRNSCSHEELGILLMSAIANKPKRHHFGEEIFRKCVRPMVKIGG